MTVEEQLTAKLDQERISDYDLSDEISDCDITIGTNLKELKIYIPEDLDYSQYSIDDWVRRNLPGIKISMTSERDLDVMTFRGTLSFPQYYKLVKFIIDSEEFCIILKS